MNSLHLNYVSQFEVEKSCSIQYPLSDLLRLSFNRDILVDIGKIDESIAEQIRAFFPCKKQSDVKAVKILIEKHRNLLTDIYNDCLDELKEISEDVSWINSKQGRKIIDLENKIAQIREYLKNTFPGLLLYIGRSFVDPLLTVVGGFVENETQISTISKTIKSILGGYSCEYRLKII